MIMHGKMNYDKVVEAIENLSNDDAISLINEYCDDSRSYEGHIYYMSEFEEVAKFPENWEEVFNYSDFDRHCKYCYNGVYGWEATDDPWATSCPDDIACAICNYSFDPRSVDLDLEEDEYDDE